MHCPRSAPVSEPEADWGKGGNPQSMTISPLRVSSFTSSNLCSVPTTVRKGPGRKQRSQLLPFYRDLEVSLQSELSYPWTRIKRSQVEKEVASRMRTEGLQPPWHTPEPGPGCPSPEVQLVVQGSPWTVHQK